MNTLEVLRSEGEIIGKVRELQNYEYLLGLSEQTLFTTFKAALIDNEVHAEFIGFN
jgi:hypothetical protein